MLMFQVVDAVFTTEDPSLFLMKLNEVVIKGGGDCPEMALSGIKAGINNALYKSLVYVFTDATAKDHEMFDEVYKTVRLKQLTVCDKLTIGNGSDKNILFIRLTFS
jgi:hypothetical protein